MEQPRVLKDLTKFLEKYTDARSVDDDGELGPEERDARLYLIKPNGRKVADSWKPKGVPNFPLTGRSAFDVASAINIALCDLELREGTRFFVQIYVRGSTSREAESPVFDAPFKEEDEEPKDADSGMNALVSNLMQINRDQAARIKELEERNDNLLSAREDGMLRSAKVIAEVLDSNRKGIATSATIANEFATMGMAGYREAVTASRSALETTQLATQLLAEGAGGGGGFEIPEELKAMLPAALPAAMEALGSMMAGGNKAGPPPPPADKNGRRLYLSDALRLVEEWQRGSDPPWTRADLASLAEWLLVLAEATPEPAPQAGQG